MKRIHPHVPISAAQEERDSFTANFVDKGYVDAFRHQHPGVVAYTYWNYRFNCRANNKGWRLDYFMVRGITSRVSIEAG